MTSESDPLTWSLSERLDGVFQEFGRHTALVCDGSTWSYDQLQSAAARIAAAIVDESPSELARVGVLVDRRPSSYAAIMACLWSGTAYVPLNSRYPLERLRSIAAEARVTHLVFSANHRSEATRVAEHRSGSLCPRLIEVNDRWPDQRHRFGAPGRIEPASLAYVMFTSGSTGSPKGIPISRHNVDWYQRFAFDTLDLSHLSRVSQTSDLSFDLSVHDLLAAWTAGARLVVASRADLRFPDSYVQRHELTHWCSVPSLAAVAEQRGALTPGVFPSLSRSLFCGETLAGDLALMWQRACPNSTVENWYGPTEATIACTRHVLGRDGSSADVPIGRAFGENVAVVLDESLHRQRPGIPGQLAIYGPQVADGYLNAPELTSANFRSDSEGGTFYLTGDRVVMDPDGTLRFRGRVDHQVKIRGHRVELGEVESAVRSLVPGSSVVALGWPDRERVETIVCAVDIASRSVEELRNELSERLPAEMIPAHFEFFAELPLGLHGKIDRRRVLEEVRDRVTNRSVEFSPSGQTISKLLDILHSLNPAVAGTVWIGASTLFDAGLDSLGFVAFTAGIEKSCGVVLNDAEVDRLADLGLVTIAEALDSMRVTRTHRSRHETRLARFVDRWPRELLAADEPIIVAIGSSGVFRGLSAQAFEVLAADSGRPVRAFNVGFQGIDNSAITDLCRFVAETCKAARLRLDLVIYELDPAMVSTKPAPTCELPAGFFERGGADSASIPCSDVDDWVVALGGDAPVRSGERSTRASKDEQFDATAPIVPRWLEHRDREIAAIHAGEVGFYDDEIDHWAEGARVLQGCASRVIGWIHPLRPTDSHSGTSRQLDTLLLSRIRERVEMTFVDPSIYDVPREFFRNIGHIGSARGRTALTTQLWDCLGGWLDAETASKADRP